jgi:hypothetical protein
MQDGANVLFFTFINPSNMEVPRAFQKLGKLPKFDSPWVENQNDPNIKILETSGTAKILKKVHI